MSCREMTMKASWQLLLCSILQEKQRFKLMFYGGLKGPHFNDSTQGQFSGRLSMCVVFILSMCLLIPC